MQTTIHRINGCFHGNFSRTQEHKKNKLKTDEIQF